MNLIWVILIDIVIAVVAFFLGSCVWLIARFFCFYIPFTKELTTHGIIKIRGQILFVEGVSQLLVFAFLLGLCILGAHFARPSGYYVWLIFSFISFLPLKPTKDRYTRSPYSIQKFAERHYVCMDMDLFNKYYMSL